MLGWLVGADHVPSVVGELYLFWFGVAKALLRAGVVWVLYMALEPYVRRRFPELIISWSRLLAGDFRDPMVGRDILVGMLALLSLYVFRLGVELFARHMGRPAEVNVRDLSDGSLREAASWFLEGQVFMSLLHGLVYAFVLFLISLALGRRWAAGLGLWLRFMLVSLGGGPPPALWNFLVTGLSFAMLAFVTARFGLLAMVSA
ncbi:MAG: hypothetical protein M3416_04495 [Acidobacteriota bacterium]|nr:hypothetical protein [Acidobacteriota bacterium]